MSAFLYPVFGPGRSLLPRSGNSPCGRLTDISVLPVGLWVRGNPTDVREKPDTGISEKLTISVSGSFILERAVSNIVYNLIEIMLKERKKSQFIMLSAHECAS